MQNFISKIEKILENTCEEIEKIKFEAVSTETDEEKAKKIEIASKYYQTIISSSILFNKEIEEKVKCIYSYSSLNDNSVVFYAPKKSKKYESDDEAKLSFRIKSGKVFESDDEAKLSFRIKTGKVYESDDEAPSNLEIRDGVIESDDEVTINPELYEQLIINIPKTSVITRNGSVITCDDEVTPSFKIKTGKVYESDDEVTPSFKVKTGKVFESDDEAKLNFRIKTGKVYESDDEATTSFDIKESVIESEDMEIPNFTINDEKILDDDNDSLLNQKLPDINVENLLSGLSFDVEK